MMTEIEKKTVIFERLILLFKLILNDPKNKIEEKKLIDKQIDAAMENWCNL